MRSACICCAAFADTVYLRDGSILKGEIRLLRDSELTLNTDYAGVLTIPGDVLTGIETDQPMMLRLQDGEELQAQIQLDDQRLRLAGDDIEPRLIQLEQMAELRPVDAPVPEVLTQDADSPWSGRVQAGLGGSSGNSENQNIDVRASTLRETENNRLSFQALLHKASQDNQQTEDEIRAYARIEQDFSKRAFVFGQAEAERDQFEDIDYRFTVTLGPGYFFLEEPDHELKGRAGLGYEQERSEGGGTNNNFVATLGYNYRVELWDWFRLTHDLVWIPDIGDEPDKNYRVESALGGELPLGPEDSLWRLRGEYRHDYDNNPEPGVEELDTNYLLSIVRDLE